VISGEAMHDVFYSKFGRSKKKLITAALFSQSFQFNAHSAAEAAGQLTHVFVFVVLFWNGFDV
jgi:hypothetical protein